MHQVPLKPHAAIADCNLSELDCKHEVVGCSAEHWLHELDVGTTTKVMQLSKHYELIETMQCTVDQAVLLPCMDTTQL